nr:prepilin-type N-terminal cleavage/methylation domain-containing protein [Niveispirillum sp. BGYR6]
MHKKAFSLVELSIVLVILGLLVGGVLVGQSLIKASEMRKVGADFTKYEAAVNAFRDKYFFYPGDLPNATQFWGLAAGTAGNDVSCRNGLAAGAAPGTCDGDGNGYISRYKSGLQAMQINTESMFAWQHLSLARMVEGQYTGIPTLTPTFPYGFVAGVNIPAAPIGQNSVYGLGSTAGGTLTGTNRLVMSQPNGSGYASAYNIITLGKIAYGDTGSDQFFSAYGGLLVNETAWSFDTKYDDGVSDNGKIRSKVNASNPAAAYWAKEDGTGASQFSGCQTYLTPDDRLCTLVWVFGTLSSNI